MENTQKTITVISNATFTLFKGLTQKDLTVDNKAQPNRLNIRPTWSHGLDGEGRIQRFDFVAGKDNVCPDYITEWDSFIKMCDSGVLGIKGAYTKAKVPGVDLSTLKKLEEENKALLEKLKKLEKAEKGKNISAKNLEEA